MKSILWSMFGILVLSVVPVGTPAAAEAKKAICLVCKVKGGETEEETVKAVRTRDGQEYGFCSEDCAKEFDADPAAYLPPSFPRPAPPFELRELGGKALSTKSLAGQVVLLDFWATWCVPCRKSMPELQALHQKYAGKGFTVVGVSIDAMDQKDAVSKVKKFVTSKKITYPIAVDAEKNSAWEAYAVKAVPAAYLLDRKGQIVAQWTGAPPSSKEIEALLAEMLISD